MALVGADFRWRRPWIRAVEFRQPVSEKIRAYWQSLTVASRYLIISAIVVGLTASRLLAWTTNHIIEVAITQAATSAAPYLESYIQPHVQPLANDSELPQSSREALAQATLTTPLGEKLVRLTIWRQDGKAVFSTDSLVLGARMSRSQLREIANVRGITATFEQGQARVANGKELNARPFTKIYLPIKAPSDNSIIAVAEIRKKVDLSEPTWREVRAQTDAIAAALVLMLAGALLAGGRFACRELAASRSALAERTERLSALLENNSQLQNQHLDAARRAADTHERFLKRVGADLHDGPVQLISFGLLKLDQIRPVAEAGKAAFADHGAIQESLREALAEIRNISSGLVVPELKCNSISQVLKSVIRSHELRTYTKVELEMSEVCDVAASPALLNCIYRFVQEGLNNACRHAGGKGQAVKVRTDGKMIEVSVTDRGGGFDLTAKSNDGGRLGLIGLRDRVESLGGTFEIRSQLGAGTCIRARLGLC